MTRLINFIVNNLKVKALTKETATQAIYYIDFLLEKERITDRVVWLKNIRAKVLKHLRYLDSTIVRTKVRSSCRKFKNHFL